VRLVPAILTDDINDYRQKVALTETLIDRAQVDFMDGVFVPSVTISPAEAATVETSLALEAHLMVKEPVFSLKPLRGSPFNKAFFHYEAVPEHYAVIEIIRALEIGVGMAVNPNTAINELSWLVEELDSVLFLGVDPVHGTSFQHEVLDKIRQFRSDYPLMETGVDGGVNLENLDAIIGAGPDFICVGSAIFNAPDPELAFKEFQARIETIDD